MLNRFLVVAAFVALTSTFMGVFAKTPDGQTPAEEVVCDDLLGGAKGVCNAFCEAQDCDYIDPLNLTDEEGESCQNLAENYEKFTGGDSRWLCDSCKRNCNLDRVDCVAAAEDRHEQCLADAGTNERAIRACNRSFRASLSRCRAIERQCFRRCDRPTPP